MEETTPESPAVAEEGSASCPHCLKAAETATRNDELALAFLLALTPLMVLTLFGQVGLL